MNGSNSPDPATQLVVSGDNGGHAPAALANGHRSPPSIDKEQQPEQVSPVHSIEGVGATGIPDAPVEKEIGGRAATSNGGDDDAASEAETLIESPVKRKEAEKQQHLVVKNEKPQKSRIGGLPVPGDDDEDDASVASPMESTEMSAGKSTSSADAEGEVDVDMIDDGSDKENASSLSSARSSASNPPSRGSSRSRALSERPQGRTGMSDSPNPRKRKHRASSASLPSSKRQSMDPPKRTRLRGMHSEDIGGRLERSPSPKRSHRRAVSTQSALDGTVEGGSRLRKANATFPGVREPKLATKTTWEESDASSETTSLAHNDEAKRPQRGIGRSTSTPGRPTPREHKRHVNKYGFTYLAEACEIGDVESVREVFEKDQGALEVSEFAGNKPLQIAALNGNAEVVSYLISRGCQIDCANGDKDTPLIDAAENGHLEVVKLLLEAGVDPLRQNLKGQAALDVVTDDTEEAAPEIRAALHEAIDRWNSSEARLRREEEEELRHRAGPSKELHFMARTYENLLKLVQNNDRNGVKEFLDARVPVDNAIIAAAAKTGDLYLVNMLLAEMSEKKARQKPEKPMLSVLGTSHFEMVKALTELFNFNAVYRNRNGKTWAELAEERNGPMWRQERELLQRLYDAHHASHAGGKERRSSSPVTKRDGAKRKFLPPKEEDESDDDDDTSTRMPKRRLMSRKDMRKSGALDSDSEDEEMEDSTPEAAAPAVASGSAAIKEGVTGMNPPDTPNTPKRKLRSKSISSEPPEFSSPKSLRRRSNSFRRASGDKVSALPTLEEKMEENNSGSDAGIVVASESERLKQERTAEARFAIDEAKRLEEKRREQEAVEAEVKRAEEENARKAEAERKAEEAKLAEERRVAQEAKRKEEEVRMLEEARIAEERAQREREAEEKRRKAHRAQMLVALPAALRCVLDPEFSSKFEAKRVRDYIVRHFLPLIAFRNAEAPRSEITVLNIQTAALVDGDGLDILFKAGQPGYEGSRAGRWMTEGLEDGDLRVLDHFLARLPYNGNPLSEDAEDEMREDSETSFEDELKRTAERYNAFQQARALLRSPDSKVAVRRVRLEDVANNLHPMLKESAIDLEFMPPTAKRQEGTVKQLESQGTQDFVQRLRAFWEGGQLPTSIVDGKLQGHADMVCASFTDVTVVHEK